MTLDRRFVVAIVLSLGWATLVALGFHRLAGPAGARTREAPMKDVVVAARRLPMGSTIDRASVSVQRAPEALLPAGAFSRVEDVLDRPVVRDIETGEPVVSARIAAKGSGIGLGPLIPPGMRAISVRTNDVAGVAGFALPGTRVDVLVTGRPPGGSGAETRTVLQNITVLSAGQTIQNDAKSQPIVAALVTLLVTPVQAEALTLANAEGRVQLVLRNATDAALVTTSGRSLNDLYGAEQVEAKPARQVEVHYPPKESVGDAKALARMRAASPGVEQPQQSMVLFHGSTRKVITFPADANFQGTKQ